MNNKSTYMQRALHSSDRRYATILEKLGYGNTAMKAEEPKKQEPKKEVEKANPPTLQELRAEYEKLLGKKPYYGWDEAALIEKIEKAKT